MSGVENVALRREINGWSVRVDEGRVERAHAAGQWLDTTIAEAAAELNRAEPDRVVVVEGSTRLTVRELYSQAVQLADAMRGSGLRPGDVVSFMLPNWHEGCVVYLA